MAPQVQVLGIDAGGTMTDTFFVQSDGRFVVGKAQSNPADEGLAVMESSKDALAHWGLGVDEVYRSLVTAVFSGTAMLNRVVQRKGLKVGLIVNRGMEDHHRMGRAVQSHLGYAYEDRIHLNTHRYDPPLVPRAMTRGVTERIDVKGDVVIPLREHEVREAVRELIDLGAEGIVVSLLHSFHNPVHERRVRDLCVEEARLAGKAIPVFASTDYYPVRKESHRTNTTVLEAYAAEPSRGSLRHTQDRMRGAGAKYELRTMASHGGTIGWRARELARCLVSGPIGGVIGAKYLGEVLGNRNIVCSDIGGTSFDVAMITQGNFTIAHDPDMARLVVSLPLVAMDSTGAGAGSFIRLDPYTHGIKIGPDSAGYRVGVCRRDSGLDTVTISDCHVVLGYLNPDNFLGGTIKLDVERARRAVKEQLADPLGLSVEEAASGVIELLDSSLKEYLRSMISGKGYSPEHFVCFSYGGAGPVHTYGYTEDLGFEDVIVPAWAAGFSAFGCAAADFEYRYDKTVNIGLAQGAGDADKLAAVRTLQEAWDELGRKVVEEFRLNGFDPGDVQLKPGFRMQYQGQLNDLEIESPLPAVATAEDWTTLCDTFEEVYGRVYATAARVPELGFGVTGAILRGVVPVSKPKIPSEPVAGKEPPAEARRGTRRLYYRGRFYDAAVYAMEKLQAGNEIDGPAIVESDATTFVVPVGFATRLDAHRLFHLRQLEKAPVTPIHEA
jgi:acetone carboxylase beta subunit